MAAGCMSPAPTGIALGHQPSNVSIAASDATYQTFYTVDAWGSPSQTSTPRPQFSTPLQYPPPFRNTPPPQTAEISNSKAATQKHHEPTRSSSPSAPPPTLPLPPQTHYNHYHYNYRYNHPPKPARQDSGYESLPRRPSSSANTPSQLITRRRTSSSSTAGPSSSTATLRNRSSVRGKTIVSKPTAPHYASARASGSSLRLQRSKTLRSQSQVHIWQQQTGTVVFHFPASGPTFTTAQQQQDGTLLLPHSSRHDDDISPLSRRPTNLETGAEKSTGAETRTVTGSPPPSPPPQTQHFWTSDQTRRMEYAAIDAASRGVKGWIRRHMVPDCMVPHKERRVGFDDDGGSVRRYRLNLDGDRDGHEHGCGEKKIGESQDGTDMGFRRKVGRWWRERGAC